MTTINPSKYCAKEYNGDRPCIDPITMAELRLRLARNKIRHDSCGIVEKLLQFWRAFSR